MEVGFIFYQYLAAEKATELGVRKAVVSNPVAEELSLPNSDASYMSGKTASNDYGDVPMPTYNSTVCDGATSTCSNGYTYSSTAMATIVSTIQKIFPRVTTANVTVEYDYAPLGFVGKPCGPIPSVTVKLQNMKYNFIVLNVLVDLFPGNTLSASISMPSFVATMTAEDLSSNGSACG